MSLGSGRCHYHPERAGLGICVECRNVICTECTTQFEGINRCAKCLAARLAKVRTLAERQDWSVGNIVLALLSVALLFGIFFGLAKLVSA
jgi:hypothetical protein